MAKAKTQGPTPAGMRDKLAAYSSGQLATFFVGFDDEKTVKRVIKYAERGLAEIQARAAKRNRLRG